MSTPTPKNRHRIVVAPHLILVDGENVLLGKRQNTGYADDMWHVPGGHTEPGENTIQGLTREMKEELGITLHTGDVTLAHAIHHYNNETGEDRLQIFFRSSSWEGKIANTEPQKCSELCWFPQSSLPENMVEYARQAIVLSLKDVRFSLYGWDTNS